MSHSAYFDIVIGHIEDIVISAAFQKNVDTFMDSHYELFQREEENKLCYMTVFNDYANLLENMILKELKTRMKSKFDLDRLVDEMRTTNIKPLDGEIYELILSLTDFLVFKDLILDYKDFREGKFQNLELQIKSLTKWFY